MSLSAKNHYPTPAYRPKAGAAGRLLSILLAAMLTACAGTDSSWKQETDSGPSAEKSYSTGQYEQAAKAWQKEALNASPGQASSLRVKAADAWLLAGQPAAAQAELRWVERDTLSRQDLSRLKLVLADLALRNQRPDEAEILLKQAKQGLSTGSNRHVARNRSRAFMAAPQLPNYPGKPSDMKR